MKKRTRKLQSVRIKLFAMMAVILLNTIFFVIIANFFLSEKLYLYSKRDTLIEVYNKVRNYNSNMDIELERMALNNNFDIVIITNQNIIVYTTNQNFLSVSTELSQMPVDKIIENIEKKDILYSKNNTSIITMYDEKTGMDFMLLTGWSEEGDRVLIRMPVSSIKINSNITNRILWIISGITVLLGSMLAVILSKKVANPILELNEIAKAMSNLDFEKKYRVRDTEDEINDLGNSINIMSDKLEKTIKELKKHNLELERDIEKKSKINEMRSQFISDVSHELKTPIALIQGYAEGLVENVAHDEESRKNYAEIILDETNKMDKLVKQLLELSKLEYQAMQFNNYNFNIVELITETVRKSKFLLEEKGIEIKVLETNPILVYADEFYIEQVITNYLTNAIKYSKEINGKTKIEIRTILKDKTVRINIFNTGDNIEEENLEKIWNRFFKTDISRKRENGGTGIGLSLVKAIMNNYKNDFGVINKPEGVEFYFELNLAKPENI